MSIDAAIDFVEVNEDGSGVLHLIDRPAMRKGECDGISGQPRLRFASAPYEVTALNGTTIWGGSSDIMLGDKEIAKRIGYTRIEFVSRDEFLEAVRLWHEKRRAQPTPKEAT